MTTGEATTIALVSGYTRHIGGSGTYILSLLKGTDRGEFRFLVTGPASPEFARRCEECGATVELLPEARLFDVRVISKLHRIFKRHRVDVVHAQDPRAGLWARIAAKLAGLPAVYTVHTYVGHYFATDDIWARIRRRVYLYVEGILARQFSQRVVFVSETTRSEAIEAGAAVSANSLVIPNGVDLNTYHLAQTRADAKREEFGATPQNVVVCFVGRFTTQKGLSFLVKAAGRLVETCSQARFWLIGDGPRRGRIEEEIRHAGLSERFLLPGFRSDIPDILAACDLFVLPSRWECLPIALLEAMASGKPCVVSDVGDNGLLITDGHSGFVVPPGDVSLLAGRVATLIGDSQLREQMGARARRDSESYGVETMVRSVTAVYQNVVDS
jgi:glycosyltransferase involved in cell wall biosynthesis